MAQPRYSEHLKRFMHQWSPNNSPELDKRFREDVRQLVEAILKPPANTFEVETILSPAGGKVVVRLADYEAQLDPLDAQHLAFLRNDHDSARCGLAGITDRMDAHPVACVHRMHFSKATARITLTSIDKSSRRR